MTNGNPTKKLFLLDAFALIYRAYYAFISNPRINSKGLNTSAILGFTNTLWEVLNKQKPTHIAVVFDTPGPTGRDEVFAAYKANRQAMPEDIALSIPYIKKVIEGFNIPIIEQPGYEADDIIGTLAKQAEKNGFLTYMMTPDKDFGQLVSENILIFKPSRGGNEPEILGVPDICKKFEINRPEQLIDILGLWGDAVDNIPGIPGVGEKTAKKLIGEFGSIENLLKNTDKLSGKLKQMVEENTEKALLSKQLATIITDVPVELDEKILEREELDKNKLAELFTELEFRQLAKRILGDGKEEQTEKKITSQVFQTDLFSLTDEENPENDIPKLNNIESTPHKYFLVDTQLKIDRLAGLLVKSGEFCFDTETTGLDPITANLVGMSFSINPGEAYYVPVPGNFEEAKNIATHFKELLEHHAIVKIGQNLKYDISVLKKYGVEVREPLFDTMIAHYLLRPDMRHNMNALAETYLNYTPVPIEDLIGKKGRTQKSIADVPVEQVSDYACEDADVTLRLKNVFLPMLQENNLMKLFNEIELPLIGVLADMETEGIALDTGALKEFSVELDKDVLGLQEEIHHLSGTSFNIDSPKQLGEMLFNQLKIDEKPQKTKTGQYSTSEEVLTKLVNKHEIVQKILDFRSLRKLKSTYVDSLPGMLNPITKRIHSSFNQAVAATGRLSSDNPNLQNIPIKTQRGREVRKAFIPRNKDYVLLSADYSQIELRIIAELSGDPGMIDAFVNGIDIHTSTAAKIFNVGVDKVTRELRNRAKQVNFGISYGQTAFGLSQNLNISRAEAKEIIDSFFKQYPSLRKFMDSNIEFARKHGYVKTIMGRRRYFRDINSENAIVRGSAERNAINAPIQGSAADMIKIAMIHIHEELKKKKYKTKMILQVHDELVFDTLISEIDQVKLLVADKMKNAIPMKVPIEIEIGVGNNWLEAH